MSNEFVIYKTDNLAGGLNFKADSWVGAPNGLKPNEAIDVKNCIFDNGVDIRGGIDGLLKTDFINDLGYSDPFIFIYTKKLIVNGEDAMFVRFKSDNIDYVDRLIGSSLAGELQNTTSTLTKNVMPIVYNGILYLLDESGNKKWDGSNLTNLGIDAPPTACYTGTGGAGSLTGTYVYYFSFYNSTTNTESALSPVSGSVSPSAQEVLLSSIDTSSDSQVDQRRIYRQGAESDVIFYCGVINDNTTTTYTDDTATLTVEQDCSNNGVLADCYIGCVHHNQLFAAGKTDYENYLYYSKYYQLEAFPDTYYTVFPDKITAVLPLGIDLIVYTVSHIYRYRYVGLDETDTVIEEIANIGCRYVNTLTFAQTSDNKDCHVFWGENKDGGSNVLLFNGVDVVNIGSKLTSIVSPLVNTPSFDTDNYWIYDDLLRPPIYTIGNSYAIPKGVFWDGKYCLSIYVNPDTSENLESWIVCVDINNGNVMRLDIPLSDYDNLDIDVYMHEFIYKPGGIYVSYWPTGHIARYPALAIFRGNTVGEYYQLFTCSPQQTNSIQTGYWENISDSWEFVYQTGYFGDRNIYATLRTIAFNADTDGEDLTIKIYCDYTVKATLTCNTSSMERVELSAPSTCYGKLFSIRFEMTNSEMKDITISPPLELKVSQWRRY